MDKDVDGKSKTVILLTCAILSTLEIITAIIIVQYTNVQGWVFAMAKTIFAMAKTIFAGTVEKNGKNRGKN